MRTKASGESLLLLLDAVQVLRTENVDYAVIGAMAASVHGVIRASRDVDALLSLTMPALAGLERRFKAVGFNTELRRGDADDPINSCLGYETAAARRRIPSRISRSRKGA